MNKKLIKPIKRLSLRDEVYQTLKKSIINMELEPNERLNDKELAQQFGISRTPVREALKRLEDEGLIESLPGSSTRVAPLKPEEAKHAFVVIAALHALATQLAGSLITERHIDELERSNHELKLAIDEGDIAGAIAADEAFHKVFLNLAGNPEISLALERISPKIQRLEMAQFTAVRGRGSTERHQEIICAFKEGNHERAARLVEENWLSLGELLTEE
ncbi:GntR family transcriptional regulator [Planococcus lenghuensis]|uniref:GntR family transcriptional regulator n=1 Tax=Planococcus lenghuensis TaxID=2213202 RepID=A0A1Q2L534_9BACL|nr:GntR family transcriptional regulator [Planococcus lenghuensis]AQQ55002.1 GntR family transcriptional regulator [Planococcus lenghuensis]